MELAETTTSNAEDDYSGDWFIESSSSQARATSALIPSAAAPETSRLYTFSHAGGSPGHFLSWQPSLLDLVAIKAVCPPGVGHRFSSGRLGSVTQVAAGAAAAIDRQGGAFALFGHSMGAVIAFETARQLRTSPCGLIVSACAGPPLLPSQRVRDAAGLNGEEFAEAVEFFGGLPREVRENAELKEIVLERLRHDFVMAAKYEYREGPPLDIPLVVVVGNDDPHVTKEKAREWESMTSGRVAFVDVEGGHFYFDSRPEVLTEIIRNAFEFFSRQSMESDSESSYIEFI
ncbi:thioesterase II family protein [Natronoglycomyces albus]|uniref:Thioesterase n=1 Tax=Natronoglycomyces albus TaxID=2811108 RepID=A0A895XJV2_9ACTN|nr:alpha/beta fold hydrolase [Natronoglycomyces albus]QSB03843.1 thioesterase [Natronoglycomyces albus]